jgi:hypothetical protein
MEKLKNIVANKRVKKFFCNACIKISIVTGAGDDGSGRPPGK